MFSYQLYNLLHIIGLVLLMVALASMASTAGLERSAVGSRRPALVFHGVGLFLILLGGFGMLARLGIMHGAAFPGWLWIKIGIWVALGVSAVLPYRYPRSAVPLLVLLPVLGGLAAYMAIYKPL